MSDKSVENDRETEDRASAVAETRPKFRKNTPAEKKYMRNSRKRRMRKRRLRDIILASKKQVKQATVDLQHQIETSKQEIKKVNSQVVKLKCMTRTFWERWRWEIEKRKEEFLVNRRVIVPTSDVHSLQKVDPCLLHNPGDDKRTECYLGRGSFGIVTLKKYRGIDVAVKQLHIRSVLRDVEHEAQMIACLCHPFLPYLFGVCTASRPYKIVTQFHGFKNPPFSITIRRELDQHHIGLNDADWISVCAQILETMNYLHNNVEIIHNDITGTNILLGQPTTMLSSTSQTCSVNIGAGNYQIMLIDFGKASKSTEGKHLSLTRVEKVEYLRKFPQIPPEVIEGDSQQSTYSDMYAVGGVLYHIAESGNISIPLYTKTLLNIAEKCRSTQYLCRLNAKQALQQLQDGTKHM